MLGTLSCGWRPTCSPFLLTPSMQTHPCHTPEEHVRAFTHRIHASHYLHAPTVQVTTGAVQGEAAWQGPPIPPCCHHHPMDSTRNEVHDNRQPNLQ